MCQRFFSISAKDLNSSGPPGYGVSYDTSDMSYDMS